MKFLSRFVVVVALLTAWAIPAPAKCTINTFDAITPPTIATVGSYVGSTPPASFSASFSLTMKVTGDGVGTCTGGIGFRRTASPVQMTNTVIPTANVPYSVTTSAGSIVTFGTIGLATPAPIIIPFNAFASPVGTAVTRTTTVSTTIQFNPLAPVTTQPVGAYADNNLFVSLYDASRADAHVSARQVAVSTSVIAPPATCSVTAPPASTVLDFSSDIQPNGKPASIPKTLSWSVNCTGSSTMRLTGTALAPPVTSTPVAGFDNKINYKAQVAWGAVGATLITTPSTTTTVTGRDSGTKPVNLSAQLIPGLPILPNSYSSTLTVSIDPNF